MEQERKQQFASPNQLTKRLLHDLELIDQKMGQIPSNIVKSKSKKLLMSEMTSKIGEQKKMFNNTPFVEEGRALASPDSPLFKDENQLNEDSTYNPTDSLF